MHARAALCPVRIGREQEAADVAQLCDQLADSGRGATVLIAGEAGVGKSRLATEAMTLADERALGRLAGHCSIEAQVPYGPFVTAIRRRTRALADDELRQLFSGSALLAGVLLPELAATLPLPTSAPRAEDVFAATWHLLHRLSGPNGTLLLLEDLHWADADSLQLLSYLARELDDLPVLLIGTYRPDELHRRHPLTSVLAQLARERRYTEIALQPLGREEIRRMLSAIFDGTDVGIELTDAFVERTGGNPFFVEELAKALVERGDIYLEAGDWTRRELTSIEMPLTVRETLLARARDLDERMAHLLEVAALAGERLDVAVLAEATGLAPDDVDDALRAGLRLQLLAERHDEGRSTYAFRHALTREALADELVGPDRQRAHRRLAEAIVAVHADDLDAVAAAAADHFMEAGDTASALTYGVRAARRAAASFALDEAGRRYDRVLRLLPPEADERLGLLLEAMDAALGGPDRRLGVAFATEARALAHARGDPLREAHAVRGLEYERWLAGDGAGATALCEEGLALVQGRDDYTEAMAVRHLSRRLALVDRGDEALKLIPFGIELAERSGNTSALSGLHGTRMLLTSLGPEFDAAYSAAREAALAAGDVSAEYNLSMNAGYTLLWGGELGRSGETLRRALELGEMCAPHDAYGRAGYAWLLSLTGEYAAAEQLAAPLRAHAHIPTRIVALTALDEVAYRRGTPDATLVDELCELATATRENQRIAPALAGRARQLLMSRGVDAAAPVFWEVAQTTTYPVTRTGSHWQFSPDFAGALARAGRREELASWVSSIEQFTGNDRSPHNLAAAELCMGYLASTRGDDDASRQHLAAAAERYRRMPCPVRQAEALLALADLEWQTNRPAASAEAARQSLAVAEHITATAVAADARIALDRAENTSVVATVLITDIVDSTAQAAALGDRRWQELLHRHHAIVRNQLGRWGGQEIDTAGDGFLASFASPAQAIRCAIAARAELAQADVIIRAGLHTGECQQSGGKLTGIAVHIAARVAASAQPGQVLVSSTVRELVAGSSFQFQDEGARDFKGAPGRWRVFSVTD